MKKKKREKIWKSRVSAKAFQSRVRSIYKHFFKEMCNDTTWIVVSVLASWAKKLFKITAILLYIYLNHCDVWWCLMIGTILLRLVYQWQTRLVQLLKLFHPIIIFLLRCSCQIDKSVPICNVPLYWSVTYSTFVLICTVPLYGSVLYFVFLR